jgi:hypothetical protein
MRRTTRTSLRQVVLFPSVAQGDTVPMEDERELVRALGDLLLEALQGTTGVEGGGDEEREDHA